MILLMTLILAKDEKELFEKIKETGELGRTKKFSLVIKLFIVELFMCKDSGHDM